MNNNEQSFKRQITMLFEQQSLEFFISSIYSIIEIEKIIPLTFPGYPSNFKINELEYFTIGIQLESPKSTNLLISIFEGKSNNHQECIFNSIYFENEPLKKILLNGKTIRLFVKKNATIYSNPYNLFSFDDFMELSFKKTKESNGLIFPIENQPMRKFGEQNLYFRYKSLSNKAFILSKINDKNFGKIFFIIAFFEILNSSRSLSIIEMNMKLVLKLGLISMFKAYLKPKLFFSKTLEKHPDSCQKKNFWEKEFSSVKTLLIGGIRSGNLCAI